MHGLELLGFQKKELTCVLIVKPSCGCLDQLFTRIGIGLVKRGCHDQLLASYSLSYDHSVTVRSLLVVSVMAHFDSFFGRNFGFMMVSFSDDYLFQSYATIRCYSTH